MNKYATIFLSFFFVSHFYFSTKSFYPSVETSQFVNGLLAPDMFDTIVGHGPHVLQVSFFLSLLPLSLTWPPFYNFTHKTSLLKSEKIILVVSIRLATSVLNEVLGKRS
jgi:hypothetical protein